jgi:hypothetical protein
MYMNTAMAVINNRIITKFIYSLYFYLFVNQISFYIFSKKSIDLKNSAKHDTPATMRMNAVINRWIIFLMNKFVYCTLTLTLWVKW